MVQLIVAVMGSPDAGCRSFVNLHFWGDLNADRGLWDELLYRFVVLGRDMLLQIEEAPYSYDFPEVARVMMESLTRTANAFILMFAVDSRDSFNEMKELHQNIVRKRETDDIPFVICGNEIDVPNRQVSTEEGSEFASSIHARYIEFSTRGGGRTSDVFNEAGRALHEWLMRHPDSTDPQENNAKRRTKKKKALCSVS